MAGYTEYDGVSKLQTYLNAYMGANLVYAAQIGGPLTVDGKYGPNTASAYDTFVSNYWSKMSAVAREFKDNAVDYLKAKGILTDAQVTQVKRAQSEYQTKLAQGDTDDDGSTPPPAPDYIPPPPPVVKAGMSTTTWVVLGVVVGTAGLLAWNWYKGRNKSPKLRPARAPAGLSGCGCGG
jgi:hypothetical protein